MVERAIVLLVYTYGIYVAHSRAHSRLSTARPTKSGVAPAHDLVAPGSFFQSSIRRCLSRCFKSVRRPASDRRCTRTRRFAECPIRPNEHRPHTPGRSKTLAGAQSWGFARSPPAHVGQNLCGLNFSFVKTSPNRRALKAGRRSDRDAGSEAVLAQQPVGEILRLLCCRCSKVK